MYNLEDYKGDYLNRDEFIKVYNECSNFLHELNPFSERRDAKETRKKFKIWLSAIKNLLKHHVIKVNNSLFIGVLEMDTEYPEVYFFINQEDFDKEQFNNERS